MITAAYCQTMARYNIWMNTKLYELCTTMTDADRKQDRGAFFGSIHHTLNHILYGDLAFMSRFTGDPKQVPDFGVDLHDDFAALTKARYALDTRIAAWSETLDSEWLEQSLTYTSKADGSTRTVVHWVLVTHMFNHATHHRGQVTTLLAQMGLDPGSTDLPFMPPSSR
ncbi:MAG: DinB family protein [Pseudomonadales bacterium]